MKRSARRRTMKVVPMAVMVVVTLVALGGVAVASHDFADVPDSNPFHDDINWMAASGITEGFPDGTFRPGQPVTRQSMAAFMRRLAGDDPDVAPMVNAAELAGRLPADYDNAVSLNGRSPADFDNAVTLDGRAPADYDNAVSLNGRTPADFDDAVSLNGRTPADYDDAVTLAGRTAADFDNAVSLNGRTPADFDDAVSMAGRTPADYDDAVTLQGKTPADMLPLVKEDLNTALTAPITGTTPGTATVVDLVTPPEVGDYLLMFTGVVDSSFDSGTLTCQVGPSLLPGVSDIKVGDNAVGFSDRVTISTMYVVHAVDLTPLGVKCFHENPVGSGAVNVLAFSTVLVGIRLP